MAQTEEQILYDAFNLAEQEFGEDKSTEFLIAIVCDRCDVEYEDVIAALATFATEMKG